MISIIIPCFNIEEKIKHLFEMYESEKTDDFEVLWIDDCSTDKSYKLLCEGCDTKDNFIVLQTQQNSGPGIARNVGLEHAKGEYILFCDSDDEFNVSALSDISEMLKSMPDLDMAVFPYYVKRRNKKKRIDCYNKYGNDDMVKKSDVAKAAGQPWAKLYKKNIIQNNNIRFPNRMTGEDKCFVVNYVAHVENIIKSDIAYYTYVSNSLSITHKHSAKDINIPTTFDILQSLYHEYFPEIEEQMFADGHLLTRAKQMTAAKCSIKKIREWFINENKRYPDWIKHIDFENQSMYRKMIYKAMYKSKAIKIKYLMLLRRILY